MTKLSFEKKLEKLNLRVTEAEREQFELARLKSGFHNISSWARSVLVQAARSSSTSTEKPRRDIGIYLGSDRIFFGTNDISDEQFELALPKDAMQEGLTVDPAACRSALREGFCCLNDQFDLSRSNVLVTGRLLQGTANFIKQLVVEASGIQSVFLIEYSMANALGIDLNVKSLESQIVVSVDCDWIELAEICEAGLKNQRSFARNFSLQNSSNGENLTQLIKNWKCNASIEDSRQVKIAINDEIEFNQDTSDTDRYMIIRTKAPALKGVRKALTFAKHLM